jgi:YidC/Oxa1 family membrane protein insertase
MPRSKEKRPTATTSRMRGSATDKYWAAALLPATTAELHADFSYGLVNNTKIYQTDYRLDPQTIVPGASGAAYGRLFAGVKRVSIIDGYNEELGLNKFDLLIDRGWFYFITKPMFLAIDWIFHQVGNFGIAILIITTVIKTLFFPLANKSYAAIAKMKAIQPEMAAIRERFAEEGVVHHHRDEACAVLRLDQGSFGA